MNNPVENANISLLGTIILGIISWFTPQNIDMGLKIITAIGATASAILACRYYWYAAKEKKEKIKRMENKE